VRHFNGLAFAQPMLGYQLSQKGAVNATGHIVPGRN
jgi:hypothetical protein